MKKIKIQSDFRWWHRLYDIHYRKTKNIEFEIKSIKIYIKEWKQQI